MKNNHILNIGYPKCGTTWCWELLAQQPWFSIPREKENYDLIKTNLVELKSKTENFIQRQAGASEKIISLID